MSNRIERTLLCTLLGTLTLAAWTNAAAEPKTGTPEFPPIQGSFQPTWASLRQYKCPEWFRDAKFGIWAHWSAQCVPEQGDWYARGMYEQGNAEPWSSSQYAYHCAHYGHPSKVGFKDIDNMWKAENWDPEKLMTLYQSAGARYFCALANHHDNFDTWDSTYQPWNSVKIGPHKDIISGWAAAARRHGMRFAVSVHANRTWDWFDVSHGSDKTGPLAGVPYDGCLTRADGMGTWWDGLDPADLYGPAGAARTPEAREAYEAKFFNRTMDLITKYHPDQIYFDDGLPPTNYGLSIASNFYNYSASLHGGTVDGVMNVKEDSDRVHEAFVLDYERGQSGAIQPTPWQTDTCLGDWHYNRARFEHHSYKSASLVVRMLADVVSKNGNLLLSVPVRGDGTIDDDEVAIVKEIGAWTKVNGEAIFGTRPWTIFGEGPTKISGGGFNEGGETRMGASDFRFTTKANTLYAIAYGWPDEGHYVIRCLASGLDGIKGNITSVSLLGSSTPLKWTRTGDGLDVTVPSTKPCESAWALKIVGLDLAASVPTVPQARPEDSVVKPRDASGVMILGADQAAVHGKSIQQEANGGEPNLGFWGESSDWASWSASVPRAGSYRVVLRYSCPDPTMLNISAGPVSKPVSVPSTGDWTTYVDLPAGQMSLPEGIVDIAAKPASADTWKPINLRGIVLAPSVVEPDGKGMLTLGVVSAELQGGLKLEEQGGIDNIGFWRDQSDTATWTIHVVKPGVYHIALDYACPDPVSAVLSAGGQETDVKADGTGGWSAYKQTDVGTIEIASSGTMKIKIRPQSDGNWKPINLRGIVLAAR